MKIHEQTCNCHEGKDCPTNAGLPQPGIRLDCWGKHPWTEPSCLALQVKLHRLVRKLARLRQTLGRYIQMRESGAALERRAKLLEPVHELQHIEEELTK